MYIMETEFDNTCLVEVARVNSNQGKLGILVGGGPAPGINSAIGAATIEATNSGLEVIGIYDGFQHLSLWISSSAAYLHILLNNKSAGRMTVSACYLPSPKT